MQRTIGRFLTIWRAGIITIAAATMLDVYTLYAVAQARRPNVVQIANKHFGADAPWYIHNIPFLEIDDAEIEDVYYYRWKVFRSHLREIGPQGTMVLEFFPDVPWAREPWTDLNDSSSFHLFEGRWLRDPAVVNSLIDHLYRGGGNTRNYSESIAAASEAAINVTGDSTVLVRNLKRHGANLRALAGSVRRQMMDIPQQSRAPEKPIGNGRNQINFASVETDALRILFSPSSPGTTMRMIEFEAFEGPRP